MRATYPKSLEHLRSRGVMLTLQRRIILEFLHRHPGHWTAEQIHRALRSRYETLSRATVYNTLELLCEHSEIHALRIRRDVTHFDTNTQPHHHFLCLRCGELTDLDIRCPIHARSHLGKRRIERMVAVFEGTCEKCL